MVKYICNAHSPVSHKIAARTINPVRKTQALFPAASPFCSPPKFRVIDGPKVLEVNAEVDFEVVVAVGLTKVKAVAVRLAEKAVSGIVKFGLAVTAEVL